MRSAANIAVLLLTATLGGCVSPEEPVTVKGGDPHREPPDVEKSTGTTAARDEVEAAFDYECDGLDCFFSAAGSVISASGYVSYAWDFGDGASAASREASHSYPYAGSFTVRLLITTTNGGSDSHSETLAVQPTYRFYVEPPSAAVGGFDKVGAVHEALGLWEAVGYDFQVVSEPSAANRHVQFIKEWGGDTLGQACVTQRTDQYCLVQVGLGDSNCNGKWTPYDYATVRYVAAHEVGHAVGFEHSNDPEELMYPSAEYVYGGPCEMAAGTDRVNAGSWAGRTFSFSALTEISYSLVSGNSGEIDSGIILASDWESLTAGAQVSGWDWHQGTRSVGGAVALNEGNYILAFKCTNWVNPCAVEYMLAWKR